MSQPAAQATKAAYRTFRELHGVVVRTGKMDKTVHVRVGGQKWNSFLKKFFNDHKNHPVHDPANSLRLGDVVAIRPGWRESKIKRHVVKHIIAPGSGVPIEARAPIPSEAELIAEREAARRAKDERRMVTKLGERVEKRVGVAEAVLRKVRRELAAKGQLGQLGRAEKEGGEAVEGGRR